MNDLVQRLSQEWHPVEVTLRPERSLEAFRERLQLGYIQITFTGTRGGTELTVPLDRERSDTAAAERLSATGRVQLSGDLMLDFITVRCVAEIELPELRGRGRLELLADAAVQE